MNYYNCQKNESINQQFLLYLYLKLDFYVLNDSEKYFALEYKTKNEWCYSEKYKDLKEI